MKTTALVRLAPILLLALLGLTVSFLVACGQLAEDTGSTEDGICADGYGGYGYGYGYGDCQDDGYGYRR